MKEVPNKEIVFKNIMLGHHSVSCSEGFLIITNNSCYRVSVEMKYIIDELPNKASKDIFLQSLHNIGIEDVESVFNRLVNFGVIYAIHKPSFFKYMKKIISQIIFPKFIFMPSSFQELFFTKYFDKLLTKHLLIKLLIIGTLSGFSISLYNILSNYSNIPSAKEVSGFNFILFIIFILIGILIHEIGHSLMARFSGIGARPIGFSIYLIYPVFFTNVSGIERLALKDRLKVNLGGLASQGLLMLLLIIINLFLHNNAMNNSLMYLSYLFMFNLNPFLHTDGYWCLQDIISLNRDKKYIKLLENFYLLLFTAFTISLLITMSHWTHLGYNALIQAIVSKKFSFSHFLIIAYLGLALLLLRGIISRFKEIYQRFFTVFSNN